MKKRFSLIFLFLLFIASLTSCSCMETNFPIIGNKENVELLNELNDNWTLDENCTIENIDIDGLDAFWLHEKDTTTQKVILQLHGGAYIRNLSYRPNLYKRMAQYYVTYTNYKVLTIDYRVAPENPYPAALDDAIKAYQYLLDEGYDASNIIIAGDSAGGGLTLALTLYLRDNEMPLPKALITMSAWTKLDYDRRTPDYAKNSDPKDPYISPYYGDYTGFPKILMQVGTKDIESDTTTVAQKAKTAKVDVTVTVYQNMVHVFQALAPRIDESITAWEEIETFVNSLN